jgi:hypothetical protein
LQRREPIEDAEPGQCHEVEKPIPCPAEEKQIRRARLTRERSEPNLTIPPGEATSARLAPCGIDGDPLSREGAVPE